MHAWLKQTPLMHWKRWTLTFSGNLYVTQTTFHAFFFCRLRFTLLCIAWRSSNLVSGLSTNGASGCLDVNLLVVWHVWMAVGEHEQQWCEGLVNAVAWDRISYLTVDYKVRVRVWLSNSQQVQSMVITHMMMAMLMITASVSDTSLTPSEIHVWWLWCKDALSKSGAGMLSGGSVKVLHVLSQQSHRLHHPSASTVFTEALTHWNFPRLVFININFNDRLLTILQHSNTLYKFIRQRPRQLTPI